MTSHTTRQFRRLFRELPPAVQRSAHKAYRLWRSDPQHNSLQFKRVHATEPIFWVRVALGWRALGVRSDDDETMIWYWIAAHAEYDRIIAQY